MARRGRTITAVGAVAGAAATATLAGVAARAAASRRGQVPYSTAQVVGHDSTMLQARVYRPEGRPRAAVVMAHGWTMRASFYSQHAEQLVRHGLVVVTYDQRGHGRSSRPGPGGYALHHLGSDLEAVLAALVPSNLPVVLVGHSMGAMTVVSWAGQHFESSSHAIGAAILANTSIHEVVPAAVAALTGLDNDAIHAVARQVVHSPVPIPPGPWTDAVVKLIACGPDASPDVVSLTSRLVRSCPPQVRVGFARELHALDLREHATHLSVPTTVVTAANDLITPPSHAEALVRCLPAGQIERLGSAGHQAPIEHPGAFREIVLRQVSAATQHLDSVRRARSEPPTTATG